MLDKFATSATSPANSCEAYLLAAGRSERMGASKPLLKIGEKTIFERMATAFQNAGINRVRVIARNDDADLARIANLLGVRFIFALQPDLGMAGSIIDATNDCTSRWFAVMPCDIPLIGSETIRRLSQTKTALDVIQPEIEGRGKHPVFIRATRFMELRHLLSNGGTLRDFLSQVEAERVSFDDPSEFDDIDTPEDYQAILSRLGLSQN